MSPILSYISPEQIPPAASFLAGLVGVAMIFWQRLVGLARKTFQRIVRVFRGSSNDEPH